MFVFFFYIWKDSNKSIWATSKKNAVCVCVCAVTDEMTHSFKYTSYLSDSSLAAVEDVLEPCEADSSSASSSSSVLCLRGEVSVGTLGSLNLTVWVQESGLLPADTELLGGGFTWAVWPTEGTSSSSSSSELTSWWVYWWISFSLRIIWRFGKGRTPNLHIVNLSSKESKFVTDKPMDEWMEGREPEMENQTN